MGSPLPSLKGYKSLKKYSNNTALTFELHMERKCYLIVSETEVSRFIKYLILHRSQRYRRVV